jgi:SAM-dependent methyltransferase
MSDLYRHPEEYDLEHLNDEEDLGFYQSLSRRLAPRKLLEIGCGTGRITLPLANLGFDVIGLDNHSEMLRKAQERRRHASAEIRQRLKFVEGDMQTWSARSEFDLILSPLPRLHMCTAWKISLRCGGLATTIFGREVGCWSRSRCLIWPRLRIPSVSHHEHRSKLTSITSTGGRQGLSQSAPSQYRPGYFDPSPERTSQTGDGRDPAVAGARYP